MTKTVVDNVTWLDFIKPDHRDLETIHAVHKFHPLVLNELVQESAHSRAESYDGYVFFSCHLPVYDTEHKTSKKAEIDFLITTDHVITIRYQELEFLNEFKAHLTTPEFAATAGVHTGTFTYYLLEALNKFCLRQVAHIEQDLEGINDKLFSNHEHVILQEISFAKRNILNYWLIIKPYELLLISLEEIGTAFWNTAMKIYFKNLLTSHLRVSRQIENYRHMIESLEGTNSQLFNSKTNAIMQRFTVLAFLTFPLTLFVSLYDIPEVAEVLNLLFGGFWYSFAAAFMVTTATLMVFINKNWF